ncbi:MAG: ABC transporter permease [Candidatus Limnocylindrales bacterium]
MRPRRAFAVCRRLLDELRRDHRSLGLLFIAPIVITGLLAFILREQEAPVPRVAVVAVDQQIGPVLASAITAAANDAGLHVVDLDAGADENDARQAIRDERLDIAVVIPDGFGAELTGGGASLVVITAGVNSAQEGGYVADLRSALSGALGALAPPGISIPSLSIEHETVYGAADADILDLFAPALVAFFSYFFVFVLTGVSFLRERVGGTLERLLATPVTRGEIVTGYSLGFGVLAIVQVALLLVWLLSQVTVPAIGPLPEFTVGLGVPTAGSPALVYGITLLAALGAVNLGVFLSTYARTELQIIQFIPIVIVPQALLSGVLFPVAALPPILQPISQLMPMTYAIEGLRAVMIKGADLSSSTVQVDLLFLAGVAILFVVLAARTIRREIA